MGFKKGEGGRPVGAKNKATKAIKELSQALFDEEYWTRTKQRLLSGRIAPAVEAKLLAYAYGEPKQQIDAAIDLSLKVPSITFAEFVAAPDSSSVVN